MVVCYDCLIIRKLESLRYSNVIVGLNDTMGYLFASLDKNEPEISPSTIHAVTCIMENVPFINGSPQNTFFQLLNLNIFAFFYLNIIMNSSYMGVYCLISLLCSQG